MNAGTWMIAAIVLIMASSVIMSLVTQWLARRQVERVEQSYDREEQ